MGERAAQSSRGRRTAGRRDGDDGTGRRTTPRSTFVRRRPGLVVVVALAVVVTGAVVYIRPLQARYSRAGATLQQVAHKPAAVPEFDAEATTNGSWWYGASVTGDRRDELHVYGYRYGDGRSWQISIRLPHDSAIASLNAGSGTLAVHTDTGMSPGRQYMLNGATGEQVWNYDTCDRGRSSGQDGLLSDAVLCVDRRNGMVQLVDRRTGRWRWTRALPARGETPEILPGDLARPPGLVYDGGADPVLPSATTGRLLLVYGYPPSWVSSIDMTSGRVVSTGGVQSDVTMSYYGSPLAFDGRLFEIQDGDVAAYDLTHLDRAPIWRARIRSGLDLGEDLVVCSVRTVCLTGRHGVQAFDTATGAVTAGVPEPLSAQLTLPDGALLIDSDAAQMPLPHVHTLNAIGRKTGELGYRDIIFGDPDFALDLTDPDRPGDPTDVIAVDPATGRHTTLGKIPTLGVLGSVCAATGTRIGCLAEDGIHIYRYRSPW